MPKTKEQKEAETQAYLRTSCFTMTELKKKINELSPFNKINTKTINIIPGKTSRLQFKVEDSEKNERDVDLMITIHNKQIHINKKSFENVVIRFKQTDEALNEFISKNFEPEADDAIEALKQTLEE